MLNRIIYLLIFTVIIACGESKEKQQEDEKSASNSEVAETEEENEDLLDGDLNLIIDGTDYQLSDFDKRRSEITAMDDNQIAVRLTSLDKEKSVKILVSGEDVLADKPLEVTLDASQYGKSNHASVIFNGFLGDRDNMSNLRIYDGRAKIQQLDLNSLNVELKFDGKGIHTEMGNKGDTVAINGNLSIQLSTFVDTRKN